MAKAADIPGLDCEGSAFEGARLVLRVRLEELCALRDGALDWGDIEGVHAMRVASRRLRSALRDFRHVLPKEIPQKRLKAIADALGAVRDRDVALLALDRMHAKAEGTVAEEIERMRAEHRSRRDEAREALKDAIGEEALNRLREKLIARLDEPLKHVDGKGGHGKRGKNKEKSFRQLGREIILSRFDELHQLSHSLYQPFETEPIHRMRIAAKRLRYAMELFAPCWPEKIASFAQELAGLQKSLGELHDYDIWIADLGERLDRLHPEEIGDVEAEAEAEAVTQDSQAHQQQRAAIWLFRHFVNERIKHFRAALARWEKWEETGFLARLSTAIEAAPAAPDKRAETDSSADDGASAREEREAASATSAE